MLQSSEKKLVSNFDSPFSVSNEEDDHLIRLDAKEDQWLKDPIETDLNSLFQTEEDLIFEKQASRRPKSMKHERLLYRI